MAPELTALCTSEWQVADLMRMVWILARVKPTTQTSRFRVKKYGALNRVFRDRANQLRAHVDAYQLDADIKSAIALDEDTLRHRAAAHGFQDDWLQAPAAKAKSKKPAALQGSVQRFKVSQLTHIEGESQALVERPSDARNSGDALAPPQGCL